MWRSLRQNKEHLFSKPNPISNLPPWAAIRVGTYPTETAGPFFCIHAAARACYNLHTSRTLCRLNMSRILAACHWHPLILAHALPCFIIQPPPSHPQSYLLPVTPPNRNDASFSLYDKCKPIHCALVVPLHALGCGGADLSRGFGVLQGLWRPYPCKSRGSKVRERVAAMQRQLSTPSKPVVIHVNSINRGVTSSRNRGIQASGADWIVLQDDDVVPDPALLQAYSTAIQRHVSDDQEQLPLGFCGMIHVPAPFNGFTAAMRMSCVPNAFEIAELTRTPIWGCTANVCMRNGPWRRFVEDWENTGGGEDIDFFLRLQREVGGAIMSVPEAAVTHSWWDEGSCRAYWHFYLWGKGDGRLQQLYPEHCYPSWLCSVEVLGALPLVALVLWIVSKALGLGSVSLSFLASWLLAVALAVVEMDMLGNVAADRWFWRAVKSESLQGWARAQAAMEALRWC